MDIICMGEMLIDFTPGKEERSYVCNPGGAPANACIAIARNGLETGFLGRLGNDDFGKLLKKTLEDNQVKMLCPELTDKAVTTLAFAPSRKEPSRPQTSGNAISRQIIRKRPCRKKSGRSARWNGFRKMWKRRWEIGSAAMGLQV